MLTLLCLIVVAVAQEDLIVQTEYGSVQGRYLGDNVAKAWLGIPFAADTSGENRFRPPVAPAVWNFTMDCTAWGSACPQHCVLPEGSCNPSNQTEDCLNLNVFMPIDASSNDQLPVMVFIPGGAYVQGTAGSFIYDARLLANRGNVIIVTINYRLGLLGFLINENSDGNYGIFDQRFALQWIQNNIAKFGGNPSRVTLFGQSAGAMSVAYHLLAEESWGLFNQVIIESNPLPLPFLNHKTGRIFTEKVAEVIGCDTDDVECFRQCTGSCLEQILDTQDAGAGIKIFHIFVAFLATTPMVGDGGELSGPVFDLFNSGQVTTAPGVNIIFSACKNDGVMFAQEAFPGGEKLIRFRISKILILILFSSLLFILFSSLLFSSLSFILLSSLLILFSLFSPLLSSLSLSLSSLFSLLSSLLILVLFLLFSSLLFSSLSFILLS